MSRAFTWLHLSDLHVGQKGQSWLWPNFRSIFLEDLEGLLKEVGVIDAIIFSGDLTQRGSIEEYASLTVILEEIWGVLNRAGSDPILFTIPGNHDLTRPADSPVGEVLKDWWDKPKTRELFWAKDNNYYPHVCAAFINYESWLEDLRGHTKIRLGASTAGLIPGDTSVSLQLNGIKIGLVGLNSAFLQLTGDDYEGSLDLSVHQLLAVTEGAPSEWCLQHDINLLVTHHPTSWLKDLAHFEEQIYHPGRFTAHLFGHLHDADDVTVSRGGSGRKSVQGASLFGLEYLDNPEKTLRVHGYSIGQVQVDSEGASWKLWPRKSHVGKGGSRKFIPDHDLPLERGEEFLIERLMVRDKSVASKTVTPITRVVPNLASPAADRALPIRQVLDSTAHRIVVQAPHSSIRELEQQACSFALRSKKISWVVSDWGLGTDGFISSVLSSMKIETLPVFKVDLGNYTSRETFFSEFSIRTGCSFTDYCKALGSIGASILILDEAPVHSDISGFESDAMKIAELVTEFCIDVLVLIISRSTPKLVGTSYIHLVPLDEADTRVYLVSHPDAGPELITKSAVNDIYRYTEGVPGKIDRSVKQLRVVSLSELASEMISDSKNTGISTDSIPPSLIQAVDRLRLSKDDHSKRTWALLKILSALPSGEALQRIRYFASRMTLRSEHAEELLELSLIGVRVTSAFMSGSGEVKEKFKILYTPRQVRDHVLSLMSSAELESLTEHAIALYFGENWRSGTAILNTFLDDPKSDDRSMLMNASVLALRFLASSVAAGKEFAIKLAITVCRAYCVHEYTHNHFRDIVTICKDILLLLPPSISAHERGFFELKLANAMRMTGDLLPSVQIYEKLQLLSWSNNDKVSVLLNHAFCLVNTNPEEAVLMAKEIIGLAKHSNQAIQAHTLILEVEAEENSKHKLVKIQRDARKRGANIAANNIALTLAASTPDSIELEESLMEVQATAEKAQDYYNYARAAIQLARLYVNRKMTLPTEVLGNLIKAYQYLFGQRLAGLFDSAHRLLWDEFEKSKDIPNLLTLFKHSSFNWRLDNNEDKEKTYASRLIAMERKLLKVDILVANADTAYFLARSGKQLLLK